MWVQKKFCDLSVSQRKGFLNTLSLPKDNKDISKLYNLRIKAKSLDFVKGKSFYIITDNIGFCDNTEYSLFFTDDFMVIEVKKGRVYVKDIEDKIFSIDSKNKVSLYESNKDKIIWKSKDEMLNYCFYFAGLKYNLESVMEKKEYVSNLFFILKSSFYLNENSLFTIQPLKYKEDLGGKFKFVVKEKKVVEPQTIPDYEDKMEKELAGKSKDYYDMDDLADDDMDDFEDMPLSLHEIDIFKDYVPDNY